MYDKQSLVGHKATRVQKCPQLLAWHGDGDDIIFSSRNDFWLHETHSQQHDWVYFVLLRDIPRENLAAER
jgi:hypothetical protein